MSQYHRRVTRIFSTRDMKITAAYPGGSHPYEYLVIADNRLFHLPYFQKSISSLSFYQGLHYTFPFRSLIFH